MFGVGKALFNAATGFAKGMGASAGVHSAIKTFSPIATRAITGAGVGALGTYGYNKMSGNNYSMGRGAAMGALAFGGLKLGGAMAKGPLTGMNKASFNKFSARMTNKAAQGLRGLASNHYGKIAKVPFLGKNIPGMIKYGSAAAPGAIYGAGIGAGYGAFSDRESMMGGAFKGALLGAAYKMGRRGYSDFTRKASNVGKSNKAINPVFSTGKATKRTADADIRYQNYLNRKLKETEGVNVFHGGEQKRNWKRPSVSSVLPTGFKGRWSVPGEYNSLPNFGSRWS